MSSAPDTTTSDAIRRIYGTWGRHRLSVVPDPVAVLRNCFARMRPGGIMSVCDARMLTGPIRVLNPLLRMLYQPTTGWDPDRDLPGAMEVVFGNVTVRRINLGTLFIAASRRPE